MSVKCCSRKNSWYWQHRPGTAKAFGKVEAWLCWNARHVAEESGKISGLDASYLPAEPIIDQWACDKLLNSVKKQIAELNNPKYAEGSIVWRVMYNAPKAFGLVTGAPGIKDGSIAYPCLIDGEDVLVPSGDLRKRRG